VTEQPEHLGDRIPINPCLISRCIMTKGTVRPTAVVPW
jgi:hypothetical protein